MDRLHILLADARCGAHTVDDLTAWLSLASHVSVGSAQRCLACQGPEHICFWAGVCAAAGEVRVQNEGLLPLQVLQIRLSDALNM